MVVPFRPQASPGAIQARVDRVVPAYKAHLNDLRYSARVASNLTRTACHMMAWLAVSEADLAALDIRGVGGFLSHDCDCPADFRTELNAHSGWQANYGNVPITPTGGAARRPRSAVGRGPERLPPRGRPGSCRAAGGGSRPADSAARSLAPAGSASAGAMQSSRWRSHPARGTGRQSHSSPGAPSRMRRPGRHRIGLPSEPGRGFCQDLALHPQPAVVTPQLRQLLALDRAQAVLPLPRVQIGLLHPAQHRVRRDPELLGDLARAALAHLRHLLPELLGIGFPIVSLACLLRMGL